MKYLIQKTSDHWRKSRISEVFGIPGNVGILYVIIIQARHSPG